MNTIWGCDTETMTELSGDFAAGAEQLQGISARARLARRAVTWFGPDAEEHRSTTEELFERAEQIAEVVRRLAELLGKEATAQDICSAAEGGIDPTDPLGVRAMPPSLVTGSPLPKVAGDPEGRWRPMVGGPLRAEEMPFVGGPIPTPDLSDLWPILTRPMEPEPVFGAPLRPSPAPVAPDEKYPLDDDHLADAESIRRLALRTVPGGGIAQGILDGHDAVGDLFDGAETVLEENGLGSLTPLVDVARIPHTLTEPVLGEGSMPGQMVTGIDRGIANTLQTGEEVTTALGQGDVAEAARSAERGMHRHVGNTTDLLTATAFPTAAQSVSDVLGTGGDLADGISPGAGDGLHRASDAFQRAHDELQGGLDTITGAEAAYDLRRQYVPMPWDERP